MKLSSGRFLVSRNSSHDRSITTTIAEVKRLHQGEQPVLTFSAKRRCIFESQEVNAGRLLTVFAWKQASPNDPLGVLVCSIALNGSTRLDLARDFNPSSCAGRLPQLARGNLSFPKPIRSQP